MAKDEPAELIKLDATAWNSWRAEHDEAPNLSGASLRGLDLSGFDLSTVTINGRWGVDDNAILSLNGYVISSLLSDSDVGPSSHWTALTPFSVAVGRP